MLRNLVTFRWVSWNVVIVFLSLCLCGLIGNEIYQSDARTKAIDAQSITLETVYQDLIDKQIDVVRESLAAQERALVAREKSHDIAQEFASVARLEFEQLLAAEQSLADMKVLALALKDEVKRLKYILDNQIVKSTALATTVTEKDAEIAILWDTIHDGRSVIYQLRSEVASLEDTVAKRDTEIQTLCDLNQQAQMCIDLLRSEVATLTDTVAENDIEIATLGNYLRESRVVIDQLRSDVAELQDQLDQKIQILEATIDRLELYEDTEALLHPSAPELQPVSPGVEETLNNIPPNKVSGRYHLRRRSARFFRRIVTV